MSGILQHIWGKSRAVDRVWAQVSGLAPDKAGRRLFLVLQAFIDDSYKADGIFVLAGYIATAESWANFSKEWEEILPLGLRNSEGNFYFKMSEMALIPERMSRVPAFYRVIEKNTLMALSCSINLRELKKAKQRLSIPGRRIKWGRVCNPYYFTFRCLLEMFHYNKSSLSPDVIPDEKVDFYFDNQAEKKWILPTWDRYIKARREDYRHNYGATPRFEDDLDFLPLQAADF